MPGLIKSEDEYQLYLDLLEERDNKQKEIDELLEENKLISEAEEALDQNIAQLENDVDQNTHETAKKGSDKSRMLLSKKTGSLGDSQSLNSRGKRRTGSLKKVSQGIM
jgi:hypothetical protein